VKISDTIVGNGLPSVGNRNISSYDKTNTSIAMLYVGNDGTAVY
jgi:hypothetical protein